MKIRSKLMRDVQSYADHTPEATTDVLNCSLGSNPYGYSTVVDDAIAKFDSTKLADYPHSQAAHNAIIKFWKSITPNLAKDNIVLTDGSLGGLYLVNNVFRGDNAKVLGFSPSFTNMVEDVDLSGMEYCSINMSSENNYIQNADDMLSEISETQSLVYIDRPNNPTGQTMPLNQVERIVAKAAEFDLPVVIDEAYGGFIPREESAMTLFEKYSNVIVTRSFSKGVGLAGLRAGYVIAPENITALIRKISNPYMMNEFSREIVAAALTDENYSCSHQDEINEVKKLVRGACKDKLYMAATDDRVPIFTLIHKDESVDLQKILFEHCILAVSCVEFRNMSKNAVRIRTPKIEDVDILIKAIETIENA